MEIKRRASSTYKIESALKNEVGMLENRTLRVGILPGLVGPFTQKRQTSTGEVFYQGISIEILERLAGSLKFKYKLVTPSDGEYGVMLPNGSFTGLVGMLQRKEADLVVSDLTVTESRSTAAEFVTTPFHTEQISILFTAPNTTSIPLGLWKWTSPFSSYLWLCFFAISIVCIFYLYACHAMIAAEDRYGSRNSPFGKLGTCVAYMFGGYVNKSVVNLRGTIPWWTHVLLIVWWLQCLLEVASYGSFLIATMTASIPVPLPFDDLPSLADLVKRGEYKVCLRMGSSFSQTVLDSTDGDYSILGDFLRANPSYIRPNQNGCVELVEADPKVAYLAEHHTMEAYQQILCENHTLLIIRQNFYVMRYSVALQKDSPFTEVFSVSALDSVLERGLVQLWYYNYSRIPHMCDIKTLDDFRSPQASADPLSLKELCSVFLLFNFGVGLSVVAIAFEIALDRRKESPFRSFT